MIGLALGYAVGLQMAPEDEFEKSGTFGFIASSVQLFSGFLKI